jgi:hypothetical protein
MNLAIVPIVEGHAEVESIPALMWRVLNERGIYQIQVAKPVRVKRYQVVKAGQLEKAIELARSRRNCGAIVVLLDADDDCPKDLADSLLSRAQNVAAALPISVVLPKFEFEAWFLGSIESLHGICGITDVASPPLGGAETKRGAKEWLSQQMHERSYLETADQLILTRHFSFEAAHRQCRSFRKFMKDFEAILNQITPQHD